MSAKDIFNKELSPKIYKERKKKYIYIKNSLKFNKKMNNRTFQKMGKRSGHLSKDNKQKENKIYR